MASCILNTVASTNVVPEADSCASQSVANTDAALVASDASIGEKEARMTARVHDPTQSRIEALIEQQNGLMLRQLQLAEESRTHTDMAYQYKKPHEFLKTLDPCVRGLFADWREGFCGRVSEYISQSRLTIQYQDLGINGRLMKPFLDEAQKRWQWTSFYRGVAKAIDGIDPAGDAQHSIDGPDSYDIDSVYAQLRCKHASELQTFVVAHQKMCLEKIIEDVTLANQVRILEEKLVEWEAAHSGFYHPQTKQHLKSHAKTFVELVYREEMTKAEYKLNEEEGVPSSVFLTIMRIICMIVLFLAVTTMSHELLTRVFASLFALVCGMALLWEDLVMRSVRLLLGETVRRLRVLGTMPRRMRCHIPSIAW
jgi:hypothetical protein